MVPQNQFAAFIPGHHRLQDKELVSLATPNARREWRQGRGVSYGGLTGTFVFPDVTHGHTDASATRSPRTPRTRSRGSRAASGSPSRPILAVHL